MSKELQVIALETANAIARRRQELSKKSLDLEVQLKELAAQIEIADRQIGRGPEYRPTRGGELQCPICWVREGELADLRPINSEEERDKFECGRCREEFEMPA